MDTSGNLEWGTTRMRIKKTKKKFDSKWASPWKVKQAKGAVDKWRQSKNGISRPSPPFVIKFLFKINYFEWRSNKTSDTSPKECIQGEVLGAYTVF